ncbi:MAG: ABC-2 family transporter protein [Oscillospiraceae bacterium]|jgi:ABC-2 type transport system permease protein|nr:ABC-2 family transporter protein [Oscillospiraceae bacterium]
MVIRRLRKYAVIARVSLTNAITYRSSLFMRFAFYAMFVYIFMGLWGAIYREGSVNGYTYAQMVWYLAMTEGIAFALGTGIFGEMNDAVKTGSIAYQLCRPTRYVFYQLASALGQVLLNTLLFGALAAALGLLFVGPLPGFGPRVIPPLILSIALSFIQNYFTLTLLALSSFVIEDNTALFLIYQKLCFMLGMFLPVEFLPEAIQRVARNLPFSYVYWAPAKIFVSYTPELFRQVIPRQAMWAASAVALAMLAYNAGVKRLQANGG